MCGRYRFDKQNLYKSRGKQPLVLQRALFDQKGGILLFGHFQCLIYGYQRIGRKTVVFTALFLAVFPKSSGLL